ncbi:MAG: alkaline phosphatase [Clostridia bacterium]|jgi:membrane protein DedA with SNARE-associated domain|nr:alkaline phosphatase [Clostridia bacterium]
MNVSDILSFMEEYGVIILFILMFTECLNIPGYPGGFAAIAAGIAVKFNIMNFFVAFIISMSASVLSMNLVYYISFIFHEPIKKYFNKTEKKIKIYNKAIDIIKKHGVKGLFIARLIPVLRTFISIPAGLLSMNFINYLIFTILGTSLYIILNIGAGYFFTSFFI